MSIEVGTAIPFPMSFYRNEEYSQGATGGGSGFGSGQSGGGGCFGMFNFNFSQRSTLDLYQNRQQQQRQLPTNSNQLEPKESPSESVSPSPDELMSIIAKDMTRLSIQERDEAENDVHGIGHGDIENPQLLQQCMAEMDACLDTAKRGTAFELTEAMNRAYTSNLDFRAMFVRAERYRASQAAQRMIRFFEMKKDLFGTARLAKNITLDDLDVDDMEALESGGLQVCPAKDSAGRTIILIMLGLRKFKTALNMQRACFYIYMAVAEDQDAQRRGVVNVSYAVGQRAFKSVQAGLRKSVPLSFACHHFAYDDPDIYYSASRPIYLLSKENRVRFRSHLGTHVECQYALSTFGIPRVALPVNTSGDLSTVFHMAWLQKRQEMEEMEPIPFSYSSQRNTASGIAQPSVTPSPQISLPCPISAAPHNGNGNGNSKGNGNFSQDSDPRSSDILFGRGKTVFEHPGNAWFRDLVDRTIVKYESCTRMEKASIAEMIVDMVKNAGGRFLKADDDGGDKWEEVDDNTARKKVAHTFRNRRKFHSFPMKSSHSLAASNT